MNYDRPELLDRLAAEYALGTMPRLARRRVDRRRRTRPAAARAAEAWERRIAPLSTPVPPLAPPAGVWVAIDKRIDGASSGTSPARAGWIAWLRPLAALAFGFVMALGLVRLYPTAVVPVDEIVQARGTLPASYVGILTDTDGLPYVLASSTRHGRKMTLKVLRKVDVPAGKVLQLWALPAKGDPFPLGVVPAEGKGEFEMADTSEKLLSAVPRLGVSIEDAPAAAGATPGAFVLRGNCVKLW